MNDFRKYKLLISILSVITFPISLFLFKRFSLEKFRLKNLHQRPIFITGCDTGFGHFLALKLLSHNIPTFAGCLTENGQKQLKEKAKNLPGQLTVLEIDVTKDESVKKACQLIKHELKGRNLWGLVCNAGIGVYGPDDWLNVDHYMKSLDVNTFGVIRVCHWFKPLIKASKGRIVIITSVFGRISFPYLGPYTVSKFATEGYADTIRLEARHFGCTVHVLEPEIFNTQISNADFINHTYEKLWDDLSEEVKHEYGYDFVIGIRKAVKGSLEKWTPNSAEPVIDAYFHALTARFPRDRYVVGKTAKYILVPMSYLPACVQVFFYTIMQRIEKVPIPDCLRKREINQ